MEKKKETALEVPVNEEKLQGYITKFKKNINPKETLWENELDEEIREIGIRIIKLLKEKELTYVDAYVTLEYVYKNLKFMSEYTHL